MLSNPLSTGRTGSSAVAELSGRLLRLAGPAIRGLSVATGTGPIDGAEHERRRQPPRRFSDRWRAHIGMVPGATPMDALELRKLTKERDHLLRGLVEKCRALDGSSRELDDMPAGPGSAVPGLLRVPDAQRHRLRHRASLARTRGTPVTRYSHGVTRNTEERGEKTEEREQTTDCRRRRNCNALQRRIEVQGLLNAADKIPSIPPPFQASILSNLRPLLPRGYRA